jgi:1,4-alpha-glucan branching enzyme
MKLRKLKPATVSQVTSVKLPAAVVTMKPVPAPKSNGIPLKLVAPGAKQVFVAGSFNDWHTAAIPLKSSPSGEWRGELKLPPGRYEYLFVVDGKWLPDPAARETAPNPFGGANSVVCVG